MKKLAFILLLGGIKTEADILKVYCASINGTIADPTIEVWSTRDFNESTITWNNRPAAIIKLAEYSSTATGIWYPFSSTSLDAYIDSITAAGEPARFALIVQTPSAGSNANWWLHPKENSYDPKLEVNAGTYYSSGDACVHEFAPNSNFGSDQLMYFGNASTPSRSMVYIKFPALSIEEEKSEHEGIRVFSNPNPFSSFTDICYSTREEGAEKRIAIEVYDITGKQVNRLVNEFHTQGSYTVRWNGDDKHGKRLPNGCYFYKIKTGDKSFTTKGILLR